MNERIKTLIGSGRIPQALVIEGGSTAEREESAHELAKAIVCSEGDAFACGMCAACKKAEANIHPDIITVEPETGKKAISVDVIRKMREDAFILPNEADGKVYIIKQADTLQDYAQNALLKILEEPPKYVTFILLVSSKATLLETVLSRVSVISLSGMDKGEVTDEQQEFADISAKQLAGALAARSEMKLLAATATLEKNYENLPLALDSLSLIIRDALVLEAGGQSSMSCAPQEAAALTETYDAERLLNMLSAIGEILTAINMHANKNLTLTRICSKLADAAGGKK